MSAALDKLKTLSTEEQFRIKAKAMAITLLDECYDTVTDRAVPAPFTQKVEMLRTVAKFADLEPKAAPPPTGVGFSIRVVYSHSNVARPGEVVIEEAPAQTEIGRQAAPAYFLASPATTLLAALLTDE